MSLRRARPGEAFAALAPRLVARAERLARAAAEMRARARHDDEGRWRRADLVWPQFPKG